MEKILTVSSEDNSITINPHRWKEGFCYPKQSIVGDLKRACDFKSKTSLWNIQIWMFVHCWSRQTFCSVQVGEKSIQYYGVSIFENTDLFLPVVNGGVHRLDPDIKRKLERLPPCCQPLSNLPRWDSLQIRPVFSLHPQLWFLLATLCLAFIPFQKTTVFT